MPCKRETIYFILISHHEVPLFFRYGMRAMVVLPPGDGYVIWIGLLVSMVLANTWGCRHYLRALDASTNSAAPTVISAASSYVLSGVIGIALFEEASSVRWWVGAMLIVFGLALVAQPRTKNKEK